MRYLLNVVNTYRVPTVEEALALRDELQEMPGCESNYNLMKRKSRSK